jgi:phosphoacetylglucosamine mutase
MDMWSWRALYTDLPSHQVKVSVPDKSKISCSEDETRILTPVDMQDDLDVAMRSVTNGRCFVRPSGTEDVVRIYAEAATQEEANELSRLTREAINKHLC